MISTSGNFASGNTQSVSFLTGLSSDELRYVSTATEFKEFYENSVKADNRFIGNYLWNEVFQYIYSANAIIENIHRSPLISETVAGQLEGEAKFIRAFCHFYLVSLFGDVPLVLTTDHAINKSIARTASAKVFQQITADLESAAGLLSGTYLDARNQASTERTRANKWAAIALLARVYLFTEQYDKAEEAATQIINQSAIFSLPMLNEVFLKNSSEAIWQLMPITPGFNTWEGFTFIQPSIPRTAVLQENLLDAFETGDQRMNVWIANSNANGTSYAYPFKYTIQTSPALSEYSMVLRLAEQYLIRGEARIMQNYISEGINDLNILRDRATDHTALPADQLPLLSPSINREEALAAVAHERRVELFSEWGHRWLDLKRTGQANTLLTDLKGSLWQAEDVLYPIPHSELDRNPQLSQNAGY